MSNNSKLPSHRVYAVTKNGERNYWHQIGALWAHTDGKGFKQTLDYLPLNGAEIVIRAVEEDTQADASAAAA